MGRIKQQRIICEIHRHFSPANARWYAWPRGEREGPFNEDQLRDDVRITSATLVWREPMARPLPLRDIPELAAVLSYKLDQEQSQPSSVGCFAMQSPDMRRDYVILCWIISLLILIWLVWLGL